MFLSMTGFGRAVRTYPWGTVTFEAVSVNHRYQEISVRLPKEISSLESQAVSWLRSLLKRGKIRLNAEIVWAEAYRTAKLDKEALSSYCAQLREAAEQLGTPPVSDLASLLALPGVWLPSAWDDVGGNKENPEEPWKTLAAEAAEALLEMKKSEGEKLHAVVEKDLLAFGRLTDSLSKRWDVAAKEAVDGLRARVEKVMERFELEIDQNRIAQEISLLADKWDVSEELARLSSHISKFREIASGAESEGRKLDFLIQEMNREVNTMGSKVNDAEFRWIIVEAKSCLEKIREQIQNVE